jgi:flagellar protein FlaG
MANKAPTVLATAQAAPLNSVASSTSAARAAPEARPAETSKLETERTQIARLSAEQTQKALQEINQVMDALSISVRFQVDPADQQVVIKVVDQESGKVIRQFPSEEVVRMSKALDNLKGMLFAQTV